MEFCNKFPREPHRERKFNYAIYKGVLWTNVKGEVGLTLVLRGISNKHYRELPHNADRELYENSLCFQLSTTMHLSRTLEHLHQCSGCVWPCTGNLGWGSSVKSSESTTTGRLLGPWKFLKPFSSEPWWSLGTI